jgi:alpha-beta hydrolase superfamily lysophospholipase
MKTHDGLTLRAYQWPSLTPSQGTVVLSHGLGEHLGRYQHVASFLNNLGWDVCGFDHRGHGHSEGKCGDIAHISCLLSDLGKFIGAARQADPARPLVLIGHSMGALVASRYVAEGLMATPADWHHPIDGLVLSSPPIDMGMNLVQRALLATLPSVVPHFCVGNGLKPEWICNAPEVVAQYRLDPLVHDRISGLLARFMEAGGRTVLALAPRWTTPTLLMWAGADRCLNPRGTELLASALPSGMVEAKVFPDMGHEIFNEVGKEAVFSTLQAWLGRNLHRSGVLA